jgi:hypothetical protein
MSSRRVYPIKIKLNGLEVEEVIIDPHYELKHSKVINDELILELVSLMNGKFYEPSAIKGDFKYFVADPLYL